MRNAMTVVIGLFLIAGISRAANSVASETTTAPVAAAKVDYTKVCPGLTGPSESSEFEVLGNVHEISCYVQMSCRIKDPHGNPYGYASYAIFTYLPKFPEVGTPFMNSSDDFSDPEQSGAVALLLAKWIGDGQSTVIGGKPFEQTSIFSKTTAESCDRLRQAKNAATPEEKEMLLTNAKNSLRDLILKSWDYKP